MKIKSTLIALAASLAVCSQSFGGDLLDRMLGMGGCGCETSCCDAPVAGPGCGSDMALAACDTGCDPCSRPKLIDFRFKINWQALPKPSFNFRNRGCNTGCNTGCDTGCDSGCASAVVVAPTCGSNNVLPVMSSIGDCGCGSAAAPSCGTDVASSCGCEAPAVDACAPSCNLLSRLRGLRGRIAARPRLFARCGGGCDTVCDSGCGSSVAAPACGSDMPAAGCNGCGSATPAQPAQPAPVVDPNA